jgi:hypothetical protein
MGKRECGPVTTVENPEDTWYGGVKITFKDGSCVRVTQKHWESICEWAKAHG